MTTGCALTRAEQAVFDCLHRSLGRWRTTREVSEQTVGWPNTSLKTHVCHLRKKLQETDWDIRSSPGLGYRLVAKF